jgi:hypothetical protein
MNRHLGLALTLALMAACQSLDEDAQYAVVILSTAASHETINNTISSALDDRSVRIARNAFTESSLISLEPAVRPGVGQGDASGMTRGKPEQFRLLRTRTGCELQRVSTAQTYTLDGVQCRRETAY